MILAEVIGTVVAQAETVPDLRGRTLLLIRAVEPDGTRVQPKPRIAVDTIGAGVGDRVLVIDEGNSGRQILREKTAPIKTLIVGFVDEVEVRGEVVYDHRSAKPTETKA